MLALGGFLGRGDVMGGGLVASRRVASRRVEDVVVVVVVLGDGWDLDIDG